METALTTIKCPSCGAILKADDNADVICCEYCDTRITLKSEEEIKKAIERKRETDELDRQREEQIEREKAMLMRREADKARKEEELKSFTQKWLIIGGILTLLGLAGVRICLPFGIWAFVYCIKERNNKLAAIDGKIKLPSISNYKERNYSDVKTVLENSGLTNVTCRQLNTLRSDVAEISYKIQSILIDGKKVNLSGGYCFPNSAVTILYNAVINLPSLLNCKEKDYGEILIALERAGFSNIKCEPLNDLFLGIMKRPGKIESIEIDGNEVFSEEEGLFVTNKWYLPDSKITISYHSLNR